MLVFTKEEIEEGLAGALGKITRKDIAIKAGVGESYIKRQFNSTEDQASWFYRALQVICAIDELDEETGEDFLQVFLSFREMSKKRRPHKERSAIDCLIKKHHLDGNFGAEILQAMADGKLTKDEIQRLSLLVSDFRKLCDLFDDAFSVELQKEEISKDVFQGLNGHARVN